MSRTEIQQLGEFGLVEKLNESIKIYHPETIQGIGDDAAVIDSKGEEYTLLSSDMLLEGVHFDLGYFPLKHLGYKVITANISDIAAMNGIPRQIMVNIGLSNRFSVEAVEEIYEGMRAACQNYKVDLVGGDTTASPRGLILSLSVMGKVEKKRITYRKSAQEKEVLCVTGDLGAAYLGLLILEQEKQVFLENPEMQPELEGKDYLLRRQLRPEARTNIIHEFRDLDLIPTSMIDVSDGLASDLMHICKQSQLGAVVFEDKLPLDKLTYETAIHYDIAPTTCALNGGEDYELLFTVTLEEYEKIKYHPEISAIGYMIPQEEGLILKTRGGNNVPIQAQGWPAS